MSSLALKRKPNLYKLINENTTPHVRRVREIDLTPELALKMKIKAEKYYKYIVNELIDEYDPSTDNGQMISIGIICKMQVLV